MFENASFPDISRLITNSPAHLQHRRRHKAHGVRSCCRYHVVSDASFSRLIARAATGKPRCHFDWVELRSLWLVLRAAARLFSA